MGRKQVGSLAGLAPHPRRSGQWKGRSFDGKTTPRIVFLPVLFSGGRKPLRCPLNARPRGQALQSRSRGKIHCAARRRKTRQARHRRIRRIRRENSAPRCFLIRLIAKASRNRQRARQSRPNAGRKGPLIKTDTHKTLPQPSFEAWKGKKDCEIAELHNSVDTLAKHASRPGGAGAGGGAVETPEARDHREAFAAWLRNPRNEKTRGELSQLETRTASSLSDGSGDYAVPSLVQGRLMMRARDANPMRGIVRTVDVSSGDVTFPLSNADAGSDWVGETDTRNNTGEPTLTGAKPTFGTLFALVEALEELIQDMAFDVQNWFTREAAAAPGASEMASIVAGRHCRGSIFIPARPAGGGVQQHPKPCAA